MGSSRCSACANSNRIGLPVVEAILELTSIGSSDREFRLCLPECVHPRRRHFGIRTARRQADSLWRLEQCAGACWGRPGLLQPGAQHNRRREHATGGSPVHGPRHDRMQWRSWHGHVRHAQCHAALGRRRPGSKRGARVARRERESCARPERPYPQKTAYRGNGGTDDARNFVCREQWAIARHLVAPNYLLTTHRDSIC